jgi:hypothetical protein
VQPLGSADLVKAYHAHITNDHDFTVEARVLTMDEKLAGKAVLLGGQVNIQRDGSVRRTASFTFHDPDHDLALDGESPFEAALFADRMVQIRHKVTVPGFGEVTTVPFVGPIARLSRDGDNLEVECQDKTSLAIRGTRPYRVKKGMNAVRAIKSILEDRTGEQRFRFPTGTRQRLPKSFNVGWADEASPWAVCQRIARQVLGMQLFYSCDGYATLRHPPHDPVFTFDSERNLTSLVDSGYDFTAAVNYARVEVGKVTVKDDALPSRHMLSKEALSRNGVPRYLPVTESMSTPSKPKAPKATKKNKVTTKERRHYQRELQKYHRQIRNVSQQAQRRANSIIEANRTLTADLSWSAVPVMHLDVDDPVKVKTPGGAVNLRLAEASIPMLAEGDMTCGRQQVMKKTTRRSRRG